MGFAQANIKSYTIPSDVTTIGGYVFYYNLQLKSITIPASVTAIDSHAFSYCQNLTTIRFMGYTAPTLNKSAFGNSATTYTGVNTAAKAKNIVYAPATALSAYQGGFWGSVLESASCCGFTLIPYERRNKFITYVSTDGNIIAPNSNSNVALSENVYGTAGAAFGRMEFLVDLNRVYGYLFYSVSDSTLKYVNLSPSTTSVGANSFYGCTSLEEFHLDTGDTVGYIGSNAFYRCTAMKAFYLNTSTIFAVGNSSVFDATSDSLIIYVPTSMVEDFKVASQWSEYADKIQGYDFD